MAFDLPGLIFLLLVGLAVGIVILTWYTARVLTRPPRRGYAFAIARNIPADPSELRVNDREGPEHIGIKAEHYSVRSRGVDLPVWDLHGCDPDGPIVILTHGWGDSRIVSLSRAPVLLRHASRLILWDLPGHGETPSSTRCSLGKHESSDLIALVDLVSGKDAQPVVLYGHSLGAGVVIEAAQLIGPPRVAAVVAEAPYRIPLTPARNVMRLARLPYRLNLPLALALIRPRFDRVQQAASLRVPLLVIHGEADAICPLQDAREIAAAPSTPPATLVEIPEAGHVDIFTAPRFASQAEAAINNFFARLSSPAPARTPLHPPPDASSASPPPLPVSPR